MTRNGALAFNSPLALGIGETKTILAIVSPPDYYASIKRWGVSFNGIDPTAEPIEVMLYRIENDGTFTNQAPNPMGPAISALNTLGRYNYSAEPTEGSHFATMFVHPQGGYEAVYGYGDMPQTEPDLGIGIRVVTPAAVEAFAFIQFGE